MFTNKYHKSCAILGDTLGKAQESLAQIKHKLRGSMPTSLYFVLIANLAILLGSCATPTDKLLDKKRWQREFLTVNQFQLLLIRNQQQTWQQTETARVHIYLSGDGRPWLGRNLIAKDPSPSNPITLQLMAQETNAAFYIGRPCYHLPPGKALQAPCNPSLWTFERYSEAIVQILTQGIKQALGPTYDKITLIGFSGGAVLATLIGERLPQVDTIVNIAGNLDVQLWAQTMGFSPLLGSINPNALTELRSDIKRIHLIGGRDQQVPSQVTDAFINKHGGKRQFFADFDHHCCWHTIWPEIINEATNIPSSDTY